jgi:hypothetical protein
MGQVVKCFLSKSKALSSNPTTVKKKEVPVRIWKELNPPAILVEILTRQLLWKTICPFPK